MATNSAKEVLAKIRGYFRENWGAPFIIGFMLLLMVAAASLSLGFEFLANEVAVYAYYALVAGVVLQLVCFLKYGERGGKED
jgi:hypothetical protein